MTQLPLIPMGRAPRKPPQCGGETYDERRDGQRLASQLHRVKAAIADGQWWTLRALVERCGGTEASVSARLRDLRKPKFAGATIERRYVDSGLWEYRMLGGAK